MSGGKFCSRMHSSRDDQNMVKVQGRREKRRFDKFFVPARRQQRGELLSR